MSHNILPGLRKRGYVVLFALCAILGLMCPDSLSAQNSGEPTSEGVHLSKSAMFDYSTKQGELKLEAFVEGETRVIHKDRSMDVVIVIDKSESMLSPLSNTARLGRNHNYGSWLNPSWRADFSGLDITKPDGYYECYVEALVWQLDRQVRYYNGKWQYLSEVGFLGGWRDIEGSGWEISIYKSKVGELMDASESFINKIKDHASSSGLDHQISLVSYPSQDSGKSADILDWTSASNTSDLFSSIESMFPYGDAVSASEALDLAGEQLEKRLSVDSYKVVIVFTGNNLYNNYVDTPPIWPWDPEVNASVFNNAISSAYSLKINPYNAVVYSLGIYASDNSTDRRNFLKYISSDYPNARSFDNHGSQISNPSHFQITTDPNALSDAFDEILSNLESEIIGGGSNVDLKADSYLLDVISEYFSFIGNASGVGLKYVDCTNYNQSTGEFTFSMTEQNPTGVSVNLSEDSEGRDVVKITGWNYSNYWCGYNASTGRVQGRKLIVTIPFILKDYSSSPSLLETNTTDSGIYGKPNGETDFVMVEPFEMPKIPFASLSVKLSGLKSGDASRFKVSSDGYSLNLMLRGVDDLGSDVIQAVNRLKPGSYTVTESSWAWGYTPVGSTTQTKVLSETTQDNVFPFELTQKSDAPKHDEASKPNVMNKSN